MGTRSLVVPRDAQPSSKHRRMLDVLTKRRRVAARQGQQASRMVWDVMARVDGSGYGSTG